MLANTDGFQLQLQATLVPPRLGEPPSCTFSEEGLGPSFWAGLSDPSTPHAGAAGYGGGTHLEEVPTFLVKSSKLLIEMLSSLVWVPSLGQDLGILSTALYRAHSRWFLSLNLSLIIISLNPLHPSALLLHICAHLSRPCASLWLSTSMAPYTHCLTSTTLHAAPHRCAFSRSSLYHSRPARGSPRRLHLYRRPRRSGLQSAIPQVEALLAASALKGDSPRLQRHRAAPASPRSHLDPAPVSSLGSTDQSCAARDPDRASLPSSRPPSPQRGSLARLPP